MNPTNNTPLAWGVFPAEWQACCRELGLPAYRAAQIWQGLHQRLLPSWEAFSVLPAALRRELAARFDIEALAVTEAREAADGVRKLLLTCRDGEAVEAVLIPAEGRMTLCISSQAGCAFRCAFCASGVNGLSRDLDAGEMVGQVIAAARLMRAAGNPATSTLPRPGNIVVMGTGEPLANYDNLMRAVRIINAPGGLEIGARHITLSTCGVVPGIRRLAGEGLQVELSVSLHAPNDALRTRLMPVNRRWPMAELLEACRDYTNATGRIVTFEYTLVRGVNDAPLQAQELAGLLRPLHGRVNLIPLSPVAEFDGRAPEPRVCEAFQQILERARINTTLRRSRGGQVDAACGQLRLRQVEQKRVTEHGTKPVSGRGRGG
jgi:23S rRNA (adenine2503-C2)-methyltransferase